MRDFNKKVSKDEWVEKLKLVSDPDNIEQILKVIERDDLDFTNLGKIWELYNERRDGNKNLIINFLDYRSNSISMIIADKLDKTKEIRLTHLY